MAKVRIQARTADSEEAEEEHQPSPPKHAFHHAHSKHVGALDILAKVYRHQGFLGWYQVSSSTDSALVVCSQGCAGHGCTNYEGGYIASPVVHVEGEV